MTLVSTRYTALAQFGGTKAEAAAGRNLQIVWAVGIGERIDKILSCWGFETLPFGDRYDYGGFDAAAGDGLWTLLFSGVEEFAESGFGVGYGPGHRRLQMVIYLVIS
jgi:hypothetical protein